MTDNTGSGADKIYYPTALADLIAATLDGDYNDLLEAHISASLSRSTSTSATADLTLTSDDQDHHFTVTVTPAAKEIS